MRAFSEIRIPRRTAISLIAGIPFVPFAVACEQAPIPPKPLFAESTRVPEEELGINPGEVGKVGDRFYLLRNKKLYPFSSQEFETYKKLTKFDRYGRKVVFPQRGIIEKYPVGFFPKTSAIIDPFTGGLKTSKSQGGEIALFFSGFTDDDGVPYSPIRPIDDTFKDIRKELHKKGWGIEDTFFFTYGVKGLAEFTPQDTARDPRDNFQHALDFVDTIAELLPGVQINAAGHSLGGLILSYVVKRRPELFNNAVYLASPLRGLRPTSDRKAAVAFLNQTLKLYGIDEKVTRFLFELFEDEQYQKELDRSTRDFVASGKKAAAILAGEDPVVPVESGLVPGITTIIGEEKQYGLVDLVAAMQNRSKHSDPLWMSQTKQKIAEMYGERLAA